MNENKGIQLVRIEEEVKKAFLDYSMSVIVARALPDVRDGLKPVHRRILHAMNELKLDPSKGYRKCAKIVGETMGNYHPHGESSIYDALVRMAQDFSIRYMLVDGHGNFGSLDGDGAAAQRYTEAKLSKISMELLSDIDKDTVDFVPNYDETDKEPTVLPSRFPNLLVNGSVGIAVGMATNIPPHNLSESIDGLVRIIDNRVNENRETDVNELLTLIKGPDFPTGANILGTSGIHRAYRTGRGKILVRSDAVIEPMGHGREMIVVTSIPYQVNKAKLIEKIADLVKEKKVEGIQDLRDESNREGIRIVIELKKDTNANVVLNNLYKYSQLQESYGINLLALSKNKPKLFTLSELLTEYLDHRKEVTTRRTQFELNKALKRAHIVEGFLIALDHIDEIISIIRANREISRSKEIISERFGLSPEQADAIVEMRLRALSGLEREKLEAEYNELLALIDECRAILTDETKLYSVIRAELIAVKTKFGDERRTKIVRYEGEINDEDLIEEDMCVITLSQYDYIKRISLSEYKSQNRGGKGIIGVTMRDEDDIKRMFLAHSHDYVLFFTNKGRVYRIKAYEIPEAGRTAKGMALVNLLRLSSDEKIAAAIPIADKGGDAKESENDDEFDTDETTGDYLIMVSKNGIIKKTLLDRYANIRSKGLTALNIREGDELIAVLQTDGRSDVMIATGNGTGIRFSEKDVRPTGRSASGVKGIELSEGDIVIGAVKVEHGQKILSVSSGGYGKCTEADEFRTQSRSGKGVKIYRTTEKTGRLVGICVANDKQELMLINSLGVIIRIRIADISTTGRVASGVKLINLDEGVSVVALAKIEEDYVDSDETEEALAEVTDNESTDSATAEQEESIAEEEHKNEDI